MTLAPGPVITIDWVMFNAALGVVVPERPPANTMASAVP